LTNEKILEVEDLLQSLSDEMLKLKSTSKHYEETRGNLQNMCESIDKISVTHQKLAGNMSQLLAEVENTRARASNEFRKQTDKINAISNDFRKQTDKILQQTANQSKGLRLLKSLMLLGVVVEVVVIILILLL